MSKKDSYWFRHDSSAGRGLKMRKMAHIYSHWGKGVYWDVVEILRDQSGYKFDSDDSSLQLLCDLIGCKSENRFITWFNDCLRIGLFIKENGHFYCPPLSENMVRWEASKNNGKAGGRPTNKPKTKPKQNLTNNLNETIIEEKSIVYNNTVVEGFIKQLKKEEIFIEGIYMTYKFEKGTMTKLINLFKEHLKIRPKNHDDFLDFRNHFASWINLKDRNGELEKFKTVKKGSL